MLRNIHLRNTMPIIAHWGRTLAGGAWFVAVSLDARPQAAAVGSLWILSREHLLLSETSRSSGEPRSEKKKGLQKICLDRCRDKDPVARKSRSMSLYRARQVMRWKRAVFRFKIATGLEAASRLRGVHRRLGHPVWKRSAQTAKRTES